MARGRAPADCPVGPPDALRARGGRFPLPWEPLVVGSGAWRRPRFSHSCSPTSCHSAPGTVASREPVPRAPPERSPDRRGRRHGSAALWRRCRPAVSRGGEPPRARERRRRPHGLHRRGRRADRDEHLRRELPQAGARPARRRIRARSTPPACDWHARRGRSPGGTSSSPARSVRSGSSRSSTQPSTGRSTPRRPGSSKGGVSTSS